MIRTILLCLFAVLYFDANVGNSQRLFGAFQRPRPGGRRPGPPNNERNACAPRCRQANRCPNETITNGFFNRNPFSCQNCMRRSCARINQRRDPIALLRCLVQATGRCSCPNLSANLRQTMMGCVECLGECVEGRTTTSAATTPATTSASITGARTDQLSPRERRMCAMQCQQSSQCPSLNQVDVDGPSCSSCLRETCGSFNQENRNEILECAVEARGNCAVCPPLNPQLQLFRQRCLTCLRQCARTQGGDRPNIERPAGQEGQENRGGRGGRFPPPARVFKVITCFRECQRRDQCPERGEVRNFMNQTRRACRECILDECGPFGASNRSDSMGCFMEAREDCSACPTLSTQQQGRARRCRFCVRQCVERRGPQEEFRGDDRSPFSFRSSRVQPLQTFACMVNCQTNNSCPSSLVTTALAKRSQNFNQECRECLAQQCDPFDPNDRRLLSACLDEARGECTACPQRTMGEQAELKNCKTCIQGCLPGGGPGDRRRPMPQFRQLSCMRECRENSTCPTMESIMGRGSPQCRSCIMQQCGSRGRGNDLNDLAVCVEDARDECSSCPMLSDEEQRNLRQCRNCIRDCGQGVRGGRFGSLARNRPIRQKIFQTLSCLENCRSRESCPSFEELRNRTMSSRRECRECVMEACGPIRQLNNRSELVDCVSEALEDCSECPTLTAEQQGRRRRCKSCVRECLPNTGRGRHRPFPRRPVRLIVCVRGCQRRGRCPEREEFIGRFQRHSQSCRNCVMNECGDFSQQNRSALADCIDDARDECSDCPDMDDDGRRRMRSCRSCVGRCLARADPCDRDRPQVCRTQCLESSRCPALPESGNGLMLEGCIICLQNETCDGEVTEALDNADGLRCLAKMRRNCPECQNGIPIVSLRRLGTCALCVNNCVKDYDNRGRYSFFLGRDDDDDDDDDDESDDEDDDESDDESHDESDDESDESDDKSDDESDSG